MKTAAHTKDLHAKVQLKILKPIHTVFEGIVDPKHMSNYFISSGSARMEEGKTVTWAWSDYGEGKLEIKVQSIEKDKHISFLWSASGINTLVNISLEPVNPGGLLNNSDLTAVREGHDFSRAAKSLNLRRASAPVVRSTQRQRVPQQLATTTLVKITETGWDKDDPGIARVVEQTHGWVHFLCGLKVYLEHGINIRVGAF